MSLPLPVSSAENYCDDWVPASPAALEPYHFGCMASPDGTFCRALLFPSLMYLPSVPDEHRERELADLAGIISMAALL